MFCRPFPISLGRIFATHQHPNCMQRPQQSCPSNPSRFRERRPKDIGSYSVIVTHSRPDRWGQASLHGCPSDHKAQRQRRVEMLRGSAAWTYSAPSPAAPEQEPSICLTFRDHWTPPLNTKSFSFNNILRSDALTLENLRELTACRAQAYESTTVTADERLSW